MRKKKIKKEKMKEQLITITKDWMALNYSKLNDLLFDGKLGNCKFEVFKTGKGANGRILGWFKMQREGLMVKRNSRHIYLPNYTFTEYACYDNFYELCKPCIQLNGNYQWTEKAALSTLVHEMCHYYCNMYGKCPVRHHGREFKEIAAYVSSKSNGIFTVERLASAEQMNEMVLNSDIKAKNDKRKENKLAKTIIMLIWKNNYEVRLVKPIHMSLVKYILKYEKNKKDTTKIQISHDKKLKEYKGIK